MKNNLVVVQSWSGGKDSTMAGILHLDKGHNVIFVCYIPMFDDEIPLISKHHYDYLFYMKSYFESRGATVHFVYGISYWNFCTRILTKGPRKGKMCGYPYFGRGKCGFARDSKIFSISNFLKSLDYDFLDIAFAVGEKNRKVLAGKECSILLEEGFTEYDCYSTLKTLGFLSPIYDFGFRDGCLLCPNGKPINRILWFNDYPSAKERLLKLQLLLLKDGCPFYPLRNYHYFIENDIFQSKFYNFSFFDELIY